MLFTSRSCRGGGSVKPRGRDQRWGVVAAIVLHSRATTHHSLEKRLGHLHGRVAQLDGDEQEVELLGTDLSRRAAFLRPEILTAPAERIEQFLEQEPRLVNFAASLVRPGGTLCL